MMTVMKLHAGAATLLLTLLQHHFDLSSSQTLGAAEYNSGFCLRTNHLTTCPTPPSFDLVRLEDYAGHWYEIGSTAKFKFFKEPGLACGEANYSKPDASKNITIAEKGTKVVGPVTAFGVTQIAASAKGICNAAREICSLLSQDSLMSQALNEIQQVATKIQLLHPLEAVKLVTANTAIGEAIQVVNVGLDALSNNVSQIQRVNGNISQANGSSNDNMDQMKNVTAQAATVRVAICTAVQNIAQARGQVLEVASKLVTAGGADLPFTSAFQLIQTAILIASTETAILGQATQMQFSLLDINNAAGIANFDKYTPTGETAQVQGFALQNSTNPGKLNMHIYGKTYPYWILALDGLPIAGYNAALVYSCQLSEDGSVKQHLFILSRTPQLAQPVIDRFLSLAQFQGIYNDCENPFLITAQNATICGTTRSTSPPPPF